MIQACILYQIFHRHDSINQLSTKCIRSPDGSHIHEILRFQSYGTSSNSPTTSATRRRPTCRACATRRASAAPGEDRTFRPARRASALAALVGDPQNFSFICQSYLRQKVARFSLQLRSRATGWSTSRCRTFAIPDFRSQTPFRTIALTTLR